MNIETLKKIGNEWVKGDMHRIYFDNLAGRYGLKLWHYNTGNVSGAQFRGDDISNSQGKRIQERFWQAKLWYDVKGGEFQSRGMADEAVEYIVNVIKAEAEQMETEVA